MKNRKVIKVILISVYLFIIFLLPHTVKAQSGWTLQQSGTTQDLYSFSFIDLNTGFVAGNNGTLLKTTNGGLNWLPQQTGTNNSFYAMSFPSANTGYIVGTGGVLVKTTNGGLNWNLYPAGSIYPQYSVYFLNESTGYVVASLALSNNTILKTTNGGLNWSTYSLNAAILKSVYFIDFNTGFVAGNNFSSGTVYKTTNGGNNWTLLSTPTGFYHSVFLNNSTTGYVAGQKIIKTVNGASSWASLYNSSNILFSIFFPVINTGYASGDNGTIVKTTNAGNNWMLQQNLATSSTLLNIFFLNTNTGYAVGTFGTIIKTTNGGEPLGLDPKSGVIPKEYSLSQNYPNPFNPLSKIEFQIPKLSNVKLMVFDALGKEISTLVNEQLNPGIYEVDFNASNYTSGVYLYRIEAILVGPSTATYIASKKMVLLK